MFCRSDAKGVDCDFRLAQDVSICHRRVAPIGELNLGPNAL